MADVFISTTRTDPDRRIVRQIVQRLAASQPALTAWSEAVLPPGQDYRQAGRRELRHARCFLLVWSGRAAQSEGVQDEIRRALEAWRLDKLLVACLDETPLPVGLGDLQIIRLPSEPPDRSAYQIDELIAAIRDRLADSRRRRLSIRAAARRKAMHRLFVWPLYPFSIGLVAMCAYAWYQLAEVPGVWRIDLPTWLLVPLAAYFLIGTALHYWELGKATAQLSGNRTSESQKKDGEKLSTGPVRPEDCEVFVSYSHKDADAVQNLVEEIKAKNRIVWMDTELGGNRTRYAGPIVTAIESCKVFALMGSRNSYASNHVVREVYVAGDENKPFLVFRLDDSAFPKEFKLFVSGHTWIDVHKLPRDELISEMELVLR